MTNLLTPPVAMPIVPKLTHPRHHPATPKSASRGKVPIKARPIWMNCGVTSTASSGVFLVIRNSRVAARRLGADQAEAVLAVQVVFNLT